MINQIGIFNSRLLNALDKNFILQFEFLNNYSYFKSGFRRTLPIPALNNVILFGLTSVTILIVFLGMYFCLNSCAG